MLEGFLKGNCFAKKLFKVFSPLEFVAFDDMIEFPKQMGQTDLVSESLNQENQQPRYSRMYMFAEMLDVR